MKEQKHNHRRIKDFIQRSSAVIVFALIVSAPTRVFAQPSAIAQGYDTKSLGISAGTLVSLATPGSDQVEQATLANAANLAGVASNSPVLEFSGGNTDSVQVVVDGSTDVLVSDVNGAVQAGDKVAVSPLAGIGMKAIGAGEVVGTAQKALSSVTSITRHVKSKNGKTTTVHIGLIPVAVSVGYYAANLSSQDSVSAYVPPFLQNLANNVTGKAVSPFRVLTGAVAMLLGFFVVTLTLYVAVRSGIISLGRNPLAEDAVRRGMVDVLIGAVGVLITTAVIVGAVLLT